MLEAAHPLIDLTIIPAIWRIVGGALLGAIIGSFLAALVTRWPRGESVVAGRSHCDSCDAPLGARDLVPLFSYGLNRGRCRRCGARIDPVHWACEAIAALIGALAFYFFPSEIALAGAVFGWALLALALIDARHLWLPDRLVLPLVLLGLAQSFLAGAPTPLQSAIGAAVAWISLHLVRTGYRLVRGREGMGGGDPKLFAAIGAWLGWPMLPFVLLLASLVGVGAVVLLHMAGKGVRADTPVPFGALLAIAAWPVWLGSDFFPSLLLG